MQAICREELSEYISSQNKTSLIITLLLPFAAITLFSVILRKYNRKIETTLAQPVNHHNLAGLVLTGITVMMYVIFMDICAIYYASTDHEHENTSLSPKFNLYLTYITVCFDAIVALYSVVIFIACFLRYCCCFKEICSESGVMFMIEKCCYIPLFYLMLGVDRSEEVWMLVDHGASASRDQPHNHTIQNNPVQSSPLKQSKKNIIQNRRDVWIYISFLYASLFCISSHLGYIFVAWVIDPSKTSSIALLALMILPYFFLMYREIYDNTKSITTGSSCKEKWKQSVLYIPPCAAVMFIFQFMVSYFKICKDIACKCCNKDAIRSNTVLNNGLENDLNHFQDENNETQSSDSDGTSRVWTA